MYAQLLMINMGPGMRSTAEKLANQFAPVLRALKGFKSVTFIGNETVGEYASLTIWESREDAEAAAKATASRLEQALSGIAKEPPTHKLFEVYEPKT